MTVLGAGATGTGTTTAGCTLPAESSPLSVCNMPPVMTVEPLMPVSDAEQLLRTSVAVKTSPCKFVRFWTRAELITDPVAPGVPWVLTSICPEVKNRAGPAPACPVAAVAVIGVAEPPGGSETVGVGPLILGGPPKRPTLEK